MANKKTKLENLIESDVEVTEVKDLITGAKSTTTKRKAKSSSALTDIEDGVRLTPANWKRFRIWLIGDTPLICHAWSEKAKKEMLKKQKKTTRGGREERNPHGDFISSLYDMGNGMYGFPVTAVKKSILSVSHKDKGVAKTLSQASIKFDSQMTRVQTAFEKAICTLPLIPIVAGEPEMREDMVRVGAGLNKTATLAYRAQFENWALLVQGKFNADAFPIETLLFLLRDAGVMCGVGDWRTEKSGEFGAFHLATEEEGESWMKFVRGKGPLPVRPKTDISDYFAEWMSEAAE
jgi:hypothetical protein